MRDLAEILDGIEPGRARALDALVLDRLLGHDPALGDGDSLDERVRGLSPPEYLRTTLGGTPAQARYPHVPCVDRELMWQREDGLRLFFNLRDLAVGLQICQGTFDPENERILARLVRSGMSVVHVSANLGYYTLLMGRAGARVHAFEAFPCNHGLPTRNIAENGLTDTVVAHTSSGATPPGARGSAPSPARRTWARCTCSPRRARRHRPAWRARRSPSPASTTWSRRTSTSRP